MFYRYDLQALEGHYVITPNSLWVESGEGAYFQTAITPKEIFPGSSLNDWQLQRLINMAKKELPRHLREVSQKLANHWIDIGGSE